MLVLLLLLLTVSRLSSFSVPSCVPILQRVRVKVYAQEGGEKEWSKALSESVTPAPGSGETLLQSSGLLSSPTDPARIASTNLLSWLTSKGEVYLEDKSSWSQAPHPLAVSTLTVDEVTNESTGRGLLARRGINEGDQLVGIPMSLCMTKSNAMDYMNEGVEGGRKWVDDNGRGIITPGTNEYIAIAVHLIYERYVQSRITGRDSTWSPYLDVLPTTTDVGCTFTWNSEDLSYLHGSPVMAATESMKLKLKSEYENTVTGPGGILERFTELTKEDYTYERWIWAFTMLFSRAIRLRNLKEGETLAMVPYADLINHSPFSQSYVDAREEGDWLFKTGGEEVVLFADRGYRKMEQIYISYGQKSNSELLLLYGFALERNPYNSVDVSVTVELGSGDPTEEELTRKKINFLKNAGRDGIIDFPIYADRYPIEMLEYLRLMLVTDDDLNGRSLEEFDYSRTVSSANEAAVLTNIIRACESQLSKYPTTEEDDIKVIEDKGMFRLLSKNGRMAVRHRRNEKRLLKRTIAALRKEMDSRGLEYLQSEGKLTSAGGDTEGVSLEGDDKKFMNKKQTRLERTLEKMGLDVDIR